MLRLLIVFLVLLFNTPVIAKKEYDTYETRERIQTTPRSSRERALDALQSRAQTILDAKCRKNNWASVTGPTLKGRVEIREVSINKNTFGDWVGAAVAVGVCYNYSGG